MPKSVFYFNKYILPKKFHKILFAFSPFSNFTYTSDENVNLEIRFVTSSLSFQIPKLTLYQTVVSFWTSGKLHSFSSPRFSNLYNETDNSTYFIGLF